MSKRYYWTFVNAETVGGKRRYFLRHKVRNIVQTVDTAEEAVKLTGEDWMNKDFKGGK